ncbi:ectoine hydrolase DoeA [Sinorhizobium prairiense]|uniref:ectoine hydrolase DoeA n=1 Tax=unclassified Sinorhizobium TaxID=2613772 RepID=UPI0023D7BCA5|nr:MULTISPECIES: ectoine hydrolase DoeA [unclassified Sinorhizobium]WEJ08595.1 ectoine hydrolase DoeA [Sinorhizobium sp. M103]WEJ13902.1 ectoine hydrolase DoeA [Sinorhizobium sp. K101]WEJ35502.1 ectoine hydrolase DoeA [Sinorhizobium sp. C101]
MVATKLNFGLEEYQTRLRKTRLEMQRRGIDALILSEPANMAWLTGYDGWSFYNHQAVIVSPEGDPIWWGRCSDENGAKRTVYFSDENCVSYCDSYVQTPACHPMEDLCKVLADRKLDKGVIGLEKDNYYFSATAFETLVAGLPNAKFVDATVLVNWQRAVKSPREIEYMRNAGQIVTRMHERILEKMEPAMRKCDLVAEIYEAALRGTPEFGGDYPSIVPMLPSGSELSACHLTWDDQPLRNNEGTYFEIAGVYKRYHVPTARTYCLGKVPQHFLDAEEATLEGMEVGLEVAKPGATCEDWAVAFFDVLEKYGLEKTTRAGYSVGLSYPPDWGEHTMSLRRGDRTVLEPGMIFHFMTGFWYEDWGFEITETVLITSDGNECLSKVPRKLFAKH